MKTLTNTPGGIEGLPKPKRNDWERSGVGSTGAQHPFRQRAQRQVRKAEQKAEQNRQVTLEELVYTFGVPLGDLMDHDETLSEIERFEADNRMEHAGVDRVMSAFERSRYARFDAMEGE